MDYSNNASLQELLNPSNQSSLEVHVSNVEQQARYEAMLELVKQKGIKLGINTYLSNAREDIKSQERNLDTIFNFKPYMIKGVVVPPVIIESKDVTETPNAMSYKTTKQTYKILKQARFSTRAPDWRQYLVFPTLDSNVDYVTFIPKEMLPANEQERKIWKETAAKSYEKGLVEGRNIVEDAVDRLKRDYLGMVTFHKFVLEGKLSMPAISSQSLAVTSTQDTIALDMKLLQIQQLPQFNSNIETWKPILQPEQIAPSYQIPKINLVSEP